MRRYNTGWRQESYRHSLSARGIKTGTAQRYILAPPLQSANVLPVQVSIIVPSTDETQAYIGDEPFARRISDEKKWFDKKFGGDTKIDTLGSYWSTSRKESIKEKGAMVQSSMSVAKYDKKRKLIASHVEKMRKKWGQETVFMQVEGNSFMTPYDKDSDNDFQQSDKIIVT